MISRRFALPHLAATAALARALAAHIGRGDVLALQGELGAGKTTFARALLRARGIMDDVPSPTFTLLQSYDTPVFPIYHFDLYRLEHADELDELGWDDARVDGLCLVEWPERAAGRLPLDILTLRFAMDAQGQRAVTLTGADRWAAAFAAL